LLFVSLAYSYTTRSLSLLQCFFLSVFLSVSLSLTPALSVSLAASFSQCLSVSLSCTSVNTRTHPKHARDHTHTHTHTHTHHRTGKREAKKSKRRKGWQGGAIRLEARTEAIVVKEVVKYAMHSSNVSDARKARRRNVSESKNRSDRSFSLYG
jgi:hypothetical protein